MTCTSEMMTIGNGGSGAGGAQAVFFEPDFSNATGRYRTRNIGGTGLWNFNFAVPFNFVSVVKLVLRGFPDASFTNQSIWLDSNYHGVGENYQTHVETDHTGLFSGTQNQTLEIDLTPVFTSISAGDICGVTVDHKTIGATIKYFHIELRYNV